MTTKEQEERLQRKLEEVVKALEEAAPITTKKRKGLPKSSFAVPEKRKLPLDTCARVRNAMSRFSQTQGLTSEERRTAYRKIIRAAGKCGIDATGFKEKFGGRYS